jgi:phosphoglycerate dehydrogenase-like enzyme
MPEVGPPKLSVHIAQPPPDGTLAILETHLASGIDISLGENPSPTTEVLVAGRPTRDQLAACPALRALLVPYAGIPTQTRELLLVNHPHLAVHNLHHNAAAAAELAVALLLAAAKTIVPADRALRRGDWRTRYDGAPTLILAEKIALVLGLGAIGMRVATACNALGMDVHAIRRRTSRPHPHHVTVHPPEVLRELLPRADALLVCLPLTPETDGMLGDHELRLIRPSAVLVNVARGAIVDEAALYRALTDGRLAAAGLDVWYRYPSTPEERANTQPSRFPFHELDNVVLSPHRGGAYRTAELEEQRMRDLATSLNAAARGEPIPYPVDLAAGY